MAVSWIGIPYTGEKFCREFAKNYLAEKGIPMPIVDSPDHATGWARVESPSENDVVVFCRAGKPNHVGVCISAKDFIHVQENSKSCVERLSSPLWSRRIEGFYRYVGS